MIFNDFHWFMADTMSNEFERVSLKSDSDVEALKLAITTLTQERDQLLKDLSAARSHAEKIETRQKELLQQLDEMEAVILKALQAG